MYSTIYPVFITFIIFRCVVCIHCSLSSHIQPPVTICRRCGQSNLQVLVPHDYPFGDVTFMGFEETEFPKDILHHLNGVLAAQAVKVATDQPPCSPMLVLGKKRGLLGFDPENHGVMRELRRQNPEQFVRPYFSNQGKLNPSQLYNLKDIIFHCGATHLKYYMEASSPRLESIMPRKALYNTTRPKLQQPSADRSLTSPATPSGSLSGSQLSLPQVQLSPEVQILPTPPRSQQIQPPAPVSRSATARALSPPASRTVPAATPTQPPVKAAAAAANSASSVKSVRPKPKSKATGAIPKAKSLPPASKPPKKHRTPVTADNVGQVLATNKQTLADQGMITKQPAPLPHPPQSSQQTAYNFGSLDIRYGPGAPIVRVREEDMPGPSVVIRNLPPSDAASTAPKNPVKNSAATKGRNPTCRGNQ